ncbi:hypothetical protein HK405_005733, partial [Cladochytrium tenue]
APTRGCPYSLVEQLENVSKDSGIPTRTPPIPTPGRLANVSFNHNVGDANGDPSDPLADLPEVQDGFSYPPLSGRAVLITAAQEELVPLAVGSARAVRRTGSVLPIEIWAAAAADMLANATAALLDLADISVHQLPDISESNAEVTAALLSQQREVVVISAYHYAAVDPAVLFETAEYKETGTILWFNDFFGSLRASQKLQNYSLATPYRRVVLLLAFIQSRTPFYVVPLHFRKDSCFVMTRSVPGETGGLAIVFVSLEIQRILETNELLINNDPVILGERGPQHHRSTAAANFFLVVW